MVFYYGLVYALLLRTLRVRVGREWLIFLLILSFTDSPDLCFLPPQQFSFPVGFVPHKPHKIMSLLYRKYLTEEPRMKHIRVSTFC